MGPLCIQLLTWPRKGRPRQRKLPGQRHMGGKKVGFPGPEYTAVRRQQQPCLHTQQRLGPVLRYTHAFLTRAAPWWRGQGHLSGFAEIGLPWGLRTGPGLGLAVGATAGRILSTHLCVPQLGLGCGNAGSGQLQPVLTICPASIQHICTDVN